MYEFFQMGGYAFYVWTSYGLALIILLANLIIPLNRKRTLLRNLARKLKLRKQQHDHTDENP